MYPGEHAQQNPNKAAVIVAATGEVQTYGELDANANRLSQLMHAHGLRPGDHVAVCMENHPRYLEVIWGLHYAGLVYTACSSRLTSGELSYIVNDCGAKVFITSHHKAAQAGEIAAETPNVSLRLMLDATIEATTDGYFDYAQQLATQPAEPLAARIAGIDMLYSSGTTGHPKGITRRFEALPLETTPAGVYTMVTVLFGGTPDTVYLSPAPMYHAAPLRFCLGVHSLGATVVMMEHFEPQQFLQLIEEYQVTMAQVVPTMFVRLTKLADDIRNRYDISSLRCIVHAAAPCPIPVKRHIIDWFGPVVHEYYAGTEGNGVIYCNSEMWLAHPGTVGRAINCVVHICDEQGDEVPAHEQGTVYLGGGNEFEYHNDPAKTASSRHPQGWSTLGDVGYLDDDGFLYLTDRKSYMIISGGVNIYPQEAENVLVTHPDVIDVAVFGVPNDDLGEEVKAVVQPLRMPADADAAKAMEFELIEFCRTQLAASKCPRTIDFRTELPRHPTGKLYKRLLKDEYWREAGRAI